jgi:hypothetical protein
MVRSLPRHGMIALTRGAGYRRTWAGTAGAAGSAGGLRPGMNTRRSPATKLTTVNTAVSATFATR